MTLDEMKESLALSFIPEYWEEILEDTETMRAVMSAELFNAERIVHIVDTYKVLTKYKEELIAAAREIEENEPLVLYLCLLEKTRRAGKASAFAVPSINGESIGYRFALLFPLLTSIPDVFCHMRSRGVPDEAIFGAMYEFEREIDRTAQRDGGRLYVTEGLYDWFQVICEKRLLRIGRLNFEPRHCFGRKVKVFRNTFGEVRILAHDEYIHKSGRILGSEHCEDDEGAFRAFVEETETEYIGHPANEQGLFEKKKATLSKSEWSLALEEKDKVIAVHIPTGDKFTEEECEKSYSDAREIFGKCFKDFDYKAFVCVSWLMDKQLLGLLKPESNIAIFQRKYTTFPVKANGKAVFSFVFALPTKTDFAILDYHTLPEETTLSRKMKKMYLDGQCIYACGGVFF